MGTKHNGDMSSATPARWYPVAFCCAACISQVAHNEYGRYHINIHIIFQFCSLFLHLHGMPICAISMPDFFIKYKASYLPLQKCRCFSIADGGGLAC